MAGAKQKLYCQAERSCQLSTTAEACGRFPAQLLHSGIRLSCLGFVLNCPRNARMEIRVTVLLLQGIADFEAYLELSRSIPYGQSKKQSLSPTSCHYVYFRGVWFPYSTSRRVRDAVGHVCLHGASFPLRMDLQTTRNYRPCRNSN